MSKYEFRIWTLKNTKICRTKTLYMSLSAKLKEKKKLYILV